MIEELLTKYGVLGLWTASLIGERVLFQKKLIKALEELKIAIRPY